MRPQLFDYLQGYDGRVFLRDLLAGITVAIVALPLAIGFAMASGVTPAQGLWIAIVGGFLIFFLAGAGWRRRITTGSRSQHSWRG